MLDTGLFPDVGVAHLLCNLEYEIGVYIALTGARLRAGDLMWSGLVSPQVSYATQHTPARWHSAECQIQLYRYFLSHINSVP